MNNSSRRAYRIENFEKVFFYLRIRIYIHRMQVHITFSVQASDLTHRSVSMSDVLGEPFRTPQNVKPFNRYSIIFLTSLSSTYCI